MKRIFKILGVAVLLLMALLIAVPFFLEAKIGDIIKNNVNGQMDADLDFSKARLSLIRSFPNAEVSLSDVVLSNHPPFDRDTLFAAKEVELRMGIMQLFKSGGEAISITSLEVDQALLNLLINADGKGNYDIVPDDGNSGDDTSDSGGGFILDLQSYSVSDSKIRYRDAASGIGLELDDFNHTGSGDLSATTSELDTHTRSKVYFTMDSTEYLSGHDVKLDALIGIDLQADKYSFLKNEAFINQLPLVFQGYVQLNDQGQDVDIDFKTPSSDFRNFLALIPSAYSKSLDGVETKGNFEVAGQFKGQVDDTHIPKFRITVKSDNASFKYPDLPMAVQDIYIDMEVENTTGITEDTFVEIRKASFRIDQGRFDLVSKITELMGNTKVNAHVVGKMDLANLAKAYPMPEGMDLKGLLDADLTTAFDMATIEAKRYENTKNSGHLKLTGFEYVSPEMPKPVYLDQTAMSFDPKQVRLEALQGRTGRSDFRATGTIDNFLGYMFNNENIEGRFNLDSNTFALDDFMQKETGGTESDSKEGEAPVAGSFKIPSFLDCTIQAKAGQVIYDNLTLTNVQGILVVKDETANLQNMSSDLLGGKINFEGSVGTREQTPDFAMKLNLADLGIAQSFQALDLFQALAPLAKIIKGTFDSDLTLSGKLTSDLSPDLSTLTGKVLVDILAGTLDPDQSQVLSSLTGKLDFLKTDALDLKGLKTYMSFENGVVQVKPFDIKYKDMDMQVSGSHNFNKGLEYKATLNVPTKYLGKEVNTLIAKIDDTSLDGLTIPVTATIGGTYDAPAVSTDLTTGVKDLTTRLIAIEKQKLIDKGTDKAKDLIGDLMNKQRTSDSTGSSTGTNTSNEVKDVIGGILGGKSKTADTIAKQDSTAQKPKVEDQVKDRAKDILGGFLGKKKKDTLK